MRKMDDGHRAAIFLFLSGQQRTLTRANLFSSSFSPCLIAALAVIAQGLWPKINHIIPDARVIIDLELSDSLARHYG